VITDYQHHLLNVLKNGMNTVHTNLKSLRRVFSLAVERGYIQSNDDPFKTIKMKGQKTMRPFLTKEEVSAIWALELPSESLIERCRDVFIWTILTGGMRVSDVMTLKKSHIHGEFVETRIKKTNSPHRIKMPKMALKILQRYYNAIVTKDGFVFGFLPSSLAVGETDALAMDRAVTSATQKYNGILKDIGKMAGIEKHISSHIARISFITIAISSGVDITTVRGIAGHSDVEMTAHYSKYIDNQGDEALSDLSEKIFSIK